MSKVGLPPWIAGVAEWLLPIIKQLPLEASLVLVSSAGEVVVDQKFLFAISVNKSIPLFGVESVSIAPPVLGFTTGIVWTGAEISEVYVGGRFSVDISLGLLLPIEAKDSSFVVQGEPKISVRQDGLHFQPGFSLRLNRSLIVGTDLVVAAQAIVPLGQNSLKVDMATLEIPVRQPSAESLAVNLQDVIISNEGVTALVFMTSSAPISWQETEGGFSGSLSGRIAGGAGATVGVVHHPQLMHT